MHCAKIEMYCYETNTILGSGLRIFAENNKQNHEKINDFDDKMKQILLNASDSWISGLMITVA